MTQQARCCQLWMDDDDDDVVVDSARDVADDILKAADTTTSSQETALPRSTRAECQEVESAAGQIFCPDRQEESPNWSSRPRQRCNPEEPVEKEDDTWTTSSEESLDALLTKHFPGCRQQKTDNLISPQEVPLGPSLFSVHNINWAINSFKPFKSPGPGGISPAHLQHAAFLDIEGAFNNVLPEAITEALTNLEIDNRLVGLISQLLTCRAVTSTLGSSTLTRLLCDIEGGGCQLVADADDVAMIFTGKYPQTLCDLMTVKLSNLAAWADKCGLGVNPELVLFTRRYKVPTLIPPKLKDSALSFSNSAKYLGLVLDKKLDWNQSTHDRSTPGKINIYSDSQAAIKSIASTTSKSTSVSKYRRSLHEMAELFDIRLVWVPGHQDIQGNCIADESARRGTTDTLLPNKEDISMPLATCKLMLHNLFEEKHNVQWYSTPNCRVARQTWPHIDKARSKTLCNLSRTDCSRVVRSITGHLLVGIHALRLKTPYNDFSRSCRDEEEEESPEHFFCFFPALSNRRRRGLGKPFLTSLGELATLAPSRKALFVKLSNWAPF
ncbi:hypothetical protein ACLKA6_018676 [Drosophila palustris]